MTFLFLIRHARSTWNAEGRMQGQADPPLDDVGREQARALAERLRGEPFRAIYSSPQARARQTAEIAFARHNPPVPITFDDRLKERDLGEWTGLTIAEVEARYGALGACVLRTDRCGAVTVETDGRRVAVRTLRPGCECPGLR